MSDQLYMGQNGFIWFFGRVVSNADPLGAGRLRVRIVGHHSDNDQELPDEALPWCPIITPITNAAIGGIGYSAVGAQINTRVFGFFADGDSRMMPVVMGTVQGSTVKEYRNNLEYGSTPQQPNVQKAIGASPAAREGDCPTGSQEETSTTNNPIPDPRGIKVNASEWALPFTGFVSSAFGERGGKHMGVDISPCCYYKQNEPGAAILNGRMRGPVGLPVRAAADGEVVYVWSSNIGQGGASTTYDQNGQGSRSYGNAIAVKHTLSTGTFITIYAHLGTHQDAGQDQPGSGVLVSKGQKVTKSQIIGYAGRTHCRTSLTHLHFEIRVGTALPKANNAINPGIIFPQLRGRHHSQLAQANSEISYTAAPVFRPEDAPVIAQEGPKE